MSQFNLIDERGNLAADAALKVFAQCLFPSDKASQRQALLVATDEAERFSKSGGPPRYRPSKLAEVLVTSFNNDAGQRAVAGYAALAYCILKAKQPEKSIKLYGAAKVIERSLKVASKSDPNPIKMVHYEGGEWILKGQQCPKTRSGIEGAWRSYASVSHLLAADAILSEWFPVTSVFAKPPEYTITLLRTAAVFEPHVTDMIEERGGEIVSVARLFGDGSIAAEPMPMGKAVLDFIGAGLPQ